MKAGAISGRVVYPALIAFNLGCLYLATMAPSVGAYPADWIVPIELLLNTSSKAFIANFGWLFGAFSRALQYPVDAVRNALHWLPWPLAITLAGIVAHGGGGWRLALFTTLSLLYMAIVGYWAESMNTLALVALSVPMAVVTGFAVGVLGFYSRRARTIINPLLDLLQTVPAFAYLLPLLLLFGFGPVVGLIASIIYSFPPMVRNTILGLRNVPDTLVEAGLMTGASPWQLFWLVRMPSALRQILLGVNQATMASLSMVIIASIIGGSADIGWEVLRTMRKAEFGESLLAGIVIALMAMVLDRITAAYALGGSDRLIGRALHRHVILAIAACAIVLLAAKWMPQIRAFPEQWVFYPAAILNAWLDRFVTAFGGALDQVKLVSYYYLLLPLRIGLDQTISPFSWGFTLTRTHEVLYALAVGAVSLGLWRRVSPAAAAICALLGIVVFFGLTELPWPGVAAAIVVMAWRIRGPRLAVYALACLSFILGTGMWPYAMFSLYLCAIGVAVAFVLGAVVGIWAASSEVVSAIVRPVIDTLQTMPLFVILIPILMVFKIGEFTALLAIIAFAIVPSIRYFEHGLRNVPAETLESATQMGATPWQMLRLVKLPLAAPVILLGLNQTIMFGISMLVITALVGTNDLGQQVYIGLGNGNFGASMIAGLGIAFMAMLADGLTQGASPRQSVA